MNKNGEEFLYYRSSIKYHSEDSMVIKQTWLYYSGQISHEIRVRRWKFIGHILRQEQGNDSNIALTWAPEGRRKRGRPRTTWRRTVEKERTECGWTTWAEARNAAADRDGWRSAVEALCATKARSS